jgi:hypothetical protein
MVSPRPPPVQTVTKVVVLEPPKALTIACELPKETIVETAMNGDLVDAYLNWKDAATQCAAKSARLHQWYEETGSSRHGDTQNKRD